MHTALHTRITAVRTWADYDKRGAWAQACKRPHNKETMTYIFSLIFVCLFVFSCLWLFCTFLRHLKKHNVFKCSAHSSVHMSC